MDTKSQRNQDEPREIRVPAVDVLEHEAGMLLLADLPGVDQSGLEVRVERQVLTITGRRPRTSEQARVHLDELGEGDFHREFRLSEDLDAGGIQASLRQGVLRLEIPKSERLRPRSIPIKTES